MNRLAYLILGLVILRPHPEVLGAQLAVYFGDLVLLLLLGFLAVRRGSLVLPPGARPGLLLGTILVLIGWCLALVNLELGVMAPDVLRFTFLGLFLVFFLDFFHSRNLGRVRILAILDQMFWVMFALVLLQLLNPPLLGDGVRLIWGSAKLRDLWHGYPRVYGSFYNANWFGIYLVFMLSIWVGQLSRMTHFEVRSMIKFVVLLVLLFLSGSRTGLVGAGVVVAVSLPWLLRFASRMRHQPRFLFSLALGIVFLVIGGHYLQVFGKLVDRYLSFQAMLLDGQADRSVVSRVSLWREGFMWYHLRPYLGYGQLPGDYLPHNSYLSVVLAMGLPSLLGTLVYAAWFFIQASMKHLRQGHQGSLVFCLFTLALAVMALSGEFFFAGQVMLLWLLSLTLSLLPEDDRVQGPPDVVIRGNNASAHPLGC